MAPRTFSTNKCTKQDKWTADELVYSRSSICYLPTCSCGFTLSLGPSISLPKSMERATQTQGNYESQQGSGSADKHCVCIEELLPFFLFLFKLREKWEPRPSPAPEDFHVMITFWWTAILFFFSCIRLKEIIHQCHCTYWNIYLCLTQNITANTTMGFNLITHSNSTLPLEISAVAHDAGTVHVWECVPEYRRSPFVIIISLHFLPHWNTCHLFG